MDVIHIREVYVEKLISMTQKELDRCEIMSQIKNKAIKQIIASKILGLTIRHIKRLYKNYLTFGPQGLISKHRGKFSTHQTGWTGLIANIIDEWK
jgi:hypothetical protein